jgi:hypothetical protein
MLKYFVIKYDMPEYNPADRSIILETSSLELALTSAEEHSILEENKNVYYAVEVYEA